MKLYKYNATTKEYEGEVTAYVDIVESRKAGEFVYRSLPFTTHLCPPKVSKNQTTIFNGQRWEIVEDYRGEVLFNLYTGTMDKVTKLGPIPKNLVSKTSKEYEAFLNKTDINSFRNLLNTLIATKFQKEMKTEIEVEGAKFPVYQTLYITSLIDNFLKQVEAQRLEVKNLEKAILLMQEQQINPEKVNVLTEELFNKEEKLKNTITNLPAVGKIVDFTESQVINIRKALNDFCKDLEKRKNKRITSIKGKSLEQLMDIRKSIEEKGL